MAVTQSFFSLNRGKQAENFFVAYLTGFMNTRSEMNRQFQSDQLALLSQDSLNDELKRYKDNIALLEEGKIDMSKYVFNKAKTRSRANLELLKGAHVRTGGGGRGNISREKAEVKNRAEAKEMMQLIDDPNFEQDIIKGVLSKHAGPKVKKEMRDQPSTVDIMYKQLEGDTDVKGKGNEPYTQEKIDEFYESEVKSALLNRGMNINNANLGKLAREIRISKERGSPGGEYDVQNQAAMEETFYNGLMSTERFSSGSRKPPRKAVPFDPDGAQRIADDSWKSATDKAEEMNKATDAEIVIERKKMTDALKRYDDKVKNYKGRFTGYEERGMGSQVANPFLQGKDEARLREPRGASSPMPRKKSLKEVDDEIMDMEDSSTNKINDEKIRQEINKALSDSDYDDITEKEADSLIMDIENEEAVATPEKETIIDPENAETPISDMTEEEVEQKVKEALKADQQVLSDADKVDKILAERKEDAADMTDMNNEEVVQKVKTVINDAVKEKPKVEDKKTKEPASQWTEYLKEGSNILATRWERDPIVKPVDEFKEAMMAMDQEEIVSSDADSGYDIQGIDSMDEIDDLQNSDLRTKDNSRIKPEHLNDISKAVGYNPKSKTYGDAYAIDSEYMNGLLKHLKNLSPEEKEKAYSILEEDLSSDEAFPVWSLIFEQKKPGDALDFE